MPKSQVGLPLTAVAWTVGTIASLLAMGVAGREVASELKPHHAAFYRSVLCVLMLLPFVFRAGLSSIRSARMMGHGLRNTVHFCGQWGWLYGLGALPLAEVIAIEFTAPIWTALLASVFIAERLTRSRVLAVALGFAGILILLRPGIAIIHPASLVVLAAAFGYAATFVITKSLVASETPLQILWWMNIIQLCLAALLSLAHLPVPSTQLWPWVMALGVGGLTSHYCMSRAFAAADVSVVVPLDFLRLPLSALVGWLLYAEGIDLFVVVGAMLILAGNWINVRQG